jgi:hypothetical protein
MLYCVQVCQTQRTTAQTNNEPSANSENTQERQIQAQTVQNTFSPLLDMLSHGRKFAIPVVTGVHSDRRHLSARKPLNNASQNKSVYIFPSITNKMQRYTIYLFLLNSLHVSGSSSAHHQ